MAMPSASPTITIARPNISGRSLIAARAAEPVYATAMDAPLDDPATAMAAAINAVPPAPCGASAAVVTAALAGAADASESAAISSPTAAMNTAQFTAVR